MSMEKRRDEIGKLLACLLVSRKGASTIRDLERDYRENEGRNIPYREFGCLSSLDFFRSISSHVKLVPGSGTYLVQPVVSDKIKHVNELVLRQRPAKRNTPARRRPSRYSHCFPSVRDPKPFIPNTVQKEIAKILVVNQSGVDKSYIAQCLDESKALPGTVDSNNVDDYLTGMPYTAVGKGDKVYPSRALSATPNIVRRKTKEIDGFEMVSPRDTEAQHNPVSTNINDRVTNEQPAGEEDWDDDYIDDEFMQSTFVNMNNNRIGDNKYQSRTADDSKPKMSSAEFINRAGSQYNRSEYDAFPRESDNAAENRKENVEPEGRDNRKADPDRLSNASYTFDSDEDVLIDPVNPRLKARLQELIQKHPDGIWCADLQQAFLNEYKVPLDYTELGFASVSTLASSIPKIFQLYRQKSHGDFLIYDATKTLPPSANNTDSSEPNNVWESDYYDDDVDPFPMDLPPETSQSLVPPDVMTHGESVGIETIPPISLGKECLEVYVVEVYTPSLFWVHLRKKRAKLSQLMEAMNDFYQREAENYYIPHIILEKGLNCVCVFENKWHRAIIKTVKPDGNVTLVFYDYGTTKTYHPDDLRYLVRTYSHLPAQAIAAGLFNVKPVQADAWTRGVSAEFYNKVADLPLIVIVVKVDRENNSMLVSLVDTQDDEEDIHINDWLVSEGFAETGQMVRNRPSNFVYRQYLACKNYRHNKFVRTPRSVQRGKPNSNECSKDVIDSQSASVSGSEFELKSASLAKDLMSRHSKYRTKRLNNVSESSEATLANCQAISNSVVHVSARVKGCSSTAVPASKVNNLSRGIIENDRFSKILRYKLNSTNHKHDYNKSDKKIVRSTFPDTCEPNQDSDLQLNDNNSSKTSKSSKHFSQNTDDSNSNKGSEPGIPKPVKYKDAGKLEFSGTFRSFYGGHTTIEPIDWSIIRNDTHGRQQTEDRKPKAKSHAIVESPAWKLYEEDAERPKACNNLDKCSYDPINKSLNSRMISDFQKINVESVQGKTEKKILPVSDCFLNGVQSNKDDYYSANGEKLWWSPDGNIQEKPGVITSLLRNRKKSFMESDNNSAKVSPEILEILRGRKSQYKANSTIPKDVSDPELYFITQLEKLADFVTVRISSKNTNVQSLKTQEKICKKPPTLLAEYPCKTKVPFDISKTRIATILDYINKKKKQNGTSISSKSSSAEQSNLANDTNNCQTVISTIDNSNRSGSLITSGKKFDLEKDFATSQLRCGGESDVILKSQKPSTMSSSIEIINSKSDSISSQNLQIESQSNESTECKSRNELQRLEKSPEEFYPTSNKIQRKVSTSSTPNVESISTDINTRDTTECNRAEMKGHSEVQESGLSDNGEESSKCSKKMKNHSKLLGNTESSSELDSDDLSCSYSNLETEITRIALPKANEDITENTKMDKIDNDDASAASEASGSEGTQNIREPSKCDHRLVNPGDDVRTGSDVPQKKCEIFSPIVNDLDLVADSDEWEVNGEWTDFIKEGNFTNHIVQRLENAYNASQSPQIVEVTDNSDLDHVFNGDDPEDKHAAELTAREIHDSKSCEMNALSHSENSDSMEQSELGFQEKLENSSEESDQPSWASMRNQMSNARNQNESVDQVTNNSGEQRLSQCSETIIDETNDVGSSIKIPTQDDNHTVAASNSEKTSARVPMSKTKSIHEMMVNFKARCNYVKVKRDFNKFENSLHSKASTSATFETEINDQIQSATSTSSKDAESRKIDESKTFCKSEMLTDSDDISSSSNCSISHQYSADEYKISSEELQASSNDAIEFIEELPKVPLTQFPILSRVKKQQFSVKPLVEDLGVRNTSPLDVSTISKRGNRSLLHESLESNNRLSQSLLDKIRLIYSNKN